MIIDFKIKRKTKLHPPGMYVSWPEKSTTKTINKNQLLVHYFRKNIVRIRELFLAGKSFNY
jgi:hypothetical protein